MNHRALPLRCITRPGQIVALIASPQDNWSVALSLVRSLPGGDLAVLVPVDDTGEVTEPFNRLISEVEADYLIPLGKVPEPLVTDVQRENRLPHGLLLQPHSPLIQEWQAYSVRQHNESLARQGDMGILLETLRRHRQRGPIPLSAVDGQPTVKQDIPVVVKPGDDAEDSLTLGQILGFYNQKLDASFPGGVPARAVHSHMESDDFFILVGSGKDVTDFFTFWNLRRCPVMRSRCIWLPRHLFHGTAASDTLAGLRDWIRNPNCQIGFPAPSDHRVPRIVWFISEADDMEELVSIHGDGWQAVKSESPDPSMLRYARLSPTTALARAKVTFGQEDAVLGVNDGDRWSILLPESPTFAGPNPVCEIHLSPFAYMHEIDYWISSRIIARSTRAGLAVYRDTFGNHSEVLELTEPHDLQVIGLRLNCQVKLSDKAGPIMALTQQLGGFSGLSVFEQPGFFRFVEDTSLESIHKRAKAQFMTILETSKQNEIERHVNELVQQMAKAIRSNRKTWHSVHALQKRGISEQELHTLYEAGIFQSGLRLTCPNCNSEGYYPTELLSDFTCMSCGWKGKPPLLGEHVSVFYSLRRLVIDLALGGGLPVILTLLKELKLHSGQIRIIPGLLVQWKGEWREIDVVLWHEGNLSFYEVKHNWKNELGSAVPFIELAQHFRAIPIFVGFEGVSELCSHLVESGIQSFSYRELMRPDNNVEGISD